MISYYELLGIIKEEKAPKKINVKTVPNEGRIYVIEYDGEEFSYYRLDKGELEDENYRFYLSECFLESMMFDKCITILDEEDEFEDIDEINDTKLGYMTSVDSVLLARINKLIRNQKKIIKKLKENNN